MTKKIAFQIVFLTLFLASCSEESQPFTDISTEFPKAVFKYEMDIKPDQEDSYFESQPKEGSVRSFEENHACAGYGVAYNFYNFLTSHLGDIPPLVPIDISYNQDFHLSGRKTISFRFNGDYLFEGNEARPFTKDEALDLMKIGKRFSLGYEPGQAMIHYSLFPEWSVIPYPFIAVEGASINAAFIEIENVEDYQDKDYEGNIIKEALKVDITYGGFFVAQNNDTIHNILSMENGKATIIIDYQQ